LLVAVPLGLLGGYRGGVLDSVIGRLYDTILAFCATRVREQHAPVHAAPPSNILNGG
jgi:hypothetical protein